MLSIKQGYNVIEELLHKYSYPANYAPRILTFVLNEANDNITNSIADNTNHIAKVLSFSQEAALNFILFKIKQNIPIEYLLHSVEFFGRTFYVDRCTHIPKPLTEYLVLSALRFITNTNDLISEFIVFPQGGINLNTPIYSTLEDLGLPSSASIIDFGTGSGNIIITVALELIKKYGVNYVKQNFEFTAIDISRCALRACARNAHKFKLNKLIDLVNLDVNDLTNGLVTPPNKTSNKNTSVKNMTFANGNARQTSQPAMGQSVKSLTKDTPNANTVKALRRATKTLAVPKFNTVIILSNPPYITNQEYKNLPSDVKKQPKIALVDKEVGGSGAAFVKGLTNVARNLIALDKKVFIFNEAISFRALNPCL